MVRMSCEVMKRNHLTNDDVAWIVPHQVNVRIIQAVLKYTEVPTDKVVVTTEKYGNMSPVMILICL